MSNSFEKAPSFSSTEDNEEKTSPLDNFQERVEPVSEEEIRQVRESRFGFAFGEEVEEGSGKYQAEFNIAMVGGKPSFEVRLHDKMIDGLSEEEVAKFNREEEVIGGKSHDVYVYRYGASLEKADAEARETEGEGESYTVEDRQYVMEERKIMSQYELQEGQVVDSAQLAEEIRDKNVVFYTGAAISEKGGVAGMTRLEEQLGIADKKNWQEAVKHLVRNSEDVGKTWSEFSGAMAENEPTETHRALTRIAEQTDSAVMTENMDLLHERAGTQAIHASGPYFRENVSIDNLKKIDAVVTVGLGYDDRGCLAWYKRHNPNGKIIAINKEKPGYFGKGDLLVKGDLHKNISQLEKEPK